MSQPAGDICKTRSVQAQRLIAMSQPAGDIGKTRSVQAQRLIKQCSALQTNAQRHSELRNPLICIRRDIAVNVGYIMLHRRGTSVVPFMCFTSQTNAHTAQVNLEEAQVSRQRAHANRQMSHINTRNAKAKFQRARVNPQGTQVNP